MKENAEETVRRLVDIEEIRDLARRYAHYVWCDEGEAAVALFVEDGEMDTGDGSPVKGRGALLKAYRSMLSRAKFRPFIHNHVVDIDGDSAAGSCYLDLRATMGGESMIGAGCYNDRYVRLDGRWFFASRSLKLEFFVPLSRGWTSGEGTGGLPRPADD